MIQYDTKDIIKRAEQLADLENSDFISDYEKLALLNEAWQMLYQKMIDANEKTWIKTVKAFNCLNLPKDFYQLSAIYTKETKEQLNRINSSQFSGYEIRNNTLYISKDYRNTEIIMEYYPVPKSLFLREKTIDSPFENTIKAASHTLYIDENNTIKDLNDNSVNFALNEIFDDYALFENAAIFEKSGNYYLVNYSDETIKALTDDFIPLIIENILYIYNKATKEILDTDNNIYLNKELNLDSETYYVYTNDDFTDFYQFTAFGYFYNENGFVSLASRKLKLVWSNNHPFAIINSNKLVKCCPDKIKIVKTEFVPYTFISPKYVMTKKKMSKLCYLEGLMEDTELDYPNNLFFTILAYMLALSFKNKQGSDISVLSAQMSNAETQFFNSISRDANEFYTIKNVNRGIVRWL